MTCVLHTNYKLVSFRKRAYRCQNIARSRNPHSKPELLPTRCHSTRPPCKLLHLRTDFPFHIRRARATRVAADCTRLTAGGDLLKDVLSKTRETTLASAQRLQRGRAPVVLGSCPFSLLDLFPPRLSAPFTRRADQLGLLRRRWPSWWNWQDLCRLPRPASPRPPPRIPRQACRPRWRSKLLHRFPSPRARR